MANPSASLPARSLVQAVRASLKLANGSVDSLDISQLLALQHELHKTLGIIGEKLSDICSENQKIVIDLSDWEDGDTGDEQMVIAAESNGPSAISEPHPEMPPPGQETVDTYHITNHGHESSSTDSPTA